MQNGQFLRREVADGLMLNSSVVRLPLRYPAYVYRQLTDLRRVPGLRTRVLIAPEYAGTVIPASRTIILQCRAKQDSWMWGIRLAMIAPAVASDISIRITETGGYPLFSNWVRGTQFVPTGLTGQPQPLYLLPTPWQIPSGLITVEVMNRSATVNAQCQLAMWIQEESDLYSQRGGLYDIQSNPSGTFEVQKSLPKVEG